MGNRPGFVQCQHRRIRGLRPGIGVAAWRLRRRSCGQRRYPRSPRFPPSALWSCAVAGWFLFVTIFAAASTMVIWRHSTFTVRSWASGRGFAAEPSRVRASRVGNRASAVFWRVRRPLQSPRWRAHILVTTCELPHRVARARACCNIVAASWSATKAWWGTTMIMSRADNLYNIADNHARTVQVWHWRTPELGASEQLKVLTERSQKLAVATAENHRNGIRKWRLSQNAIAPRSGLRKLLTSKPRRAVSPAGSKARTWSKSNAASTRLTVGCRLDRYFEPRQKPEHLRR